MQGHCVYILRSEAVSVYNANFYSFYKFSRNSEYLYGSCHWQIYCRHILRTYIAPPCCVPGPLTVPLLLLPGHKNES
ncbi:hypothetical protein FKM82_021104 [Ascaphus truei]